MFQISLTVQRSDAKPQSRKATRSMWLQVLTVKLNWPILKHALDRFVGALQFAADSALTPSPSPAGHTRTQNVFEGYSGARIMREIATKERKAHKRTAWTFNALRSLRAFVAKEPSWQRCDRASVRAEVVPDVASEPRNRPLPYACRPRKHVLGKGMPVGRGGQGG